MAETEEGQNRRDNDETLDTTENAADSVPSETEATATITANVGTSGYAMRPLRPFCYYYYYYYYFSNRKRNLTPKMIQKKRSLFVKY